MAGQQKIVQGQCKCPANRSPGARTQLGGFETLSSAGVTQIDGKPQDVYRPIRNVNRRLSTKMRLKYQEGKGSLEIRFLRRRVEVSLAASASRQIELRAVPSTDCIAEQIEAADQAAPLKAFVGLDGFVDEIIHVVDQRSAVDRWHSDHRSLFGVSPRPPEEAPIWNWWPNASSWGAMAPISMAKIPWPPWSGVVIWCFRLPTEPHPVFQPLLDRAKNVYRGRAGPSGLLTNFGIVLRLHLNPKLTPSMTSVGKKFQKGWVHHKWLSSWHPPTWWPLSTGP